MSGGYILECSVCFPYAVPKLAKMVEGIFCSDVKPYTC